MTRLTPEQIAEIKARHEADWEVINAGGSYYLVNVPQIEQDRAALLSHIESDGWQTMETAPRDGTRVLAWFPRIKSSVVVHWSRDDWTTDNYAGARDAYKDPDCWRPLPAPPETKEG